MIAELETNLLIKTNFDGCPLKYYGAYEQGMAVGAGAFYECPVSKKPKVEIVTAKAYRKYLPSWLYHMFVGVFLNVCVSNKELTKVQSDQVWSFMGGFGAIYHDDLIIGIYNFEDRKTKIYLESNKVRKLMGTYDLNLDDYLVYKALMTKSLMGKRNY
jgi:hypothetical protein